METFSDHQARTHHDRCHGGEDQEKRQYGREARRRHGRKVDEIAPGTVDTARQEWREDDQSREQRGEKRALPALWPREEEAEANAQERAQQHDVGKIGQMKHVSAQPSDEQQLGKQHEGAGQEEADLDGHGGLLLFVSN